MKGAADGYEGGLTVAKTQGGLNSLLDFFGFGLPCSKADCGDLVAGVQSERLPVK